MRIAVAATLALVLTAAEAGACSCFQLSDSQTHIAQGAQIVRGTVVSACREYAVNPSYWRIRFRIEVDWARNVDPPPLVALVSSGQSGLCGVSYFVGETALFNLLGEGPDYHTSLCDEPADARIRREDDGRPVYIGDPNLADCAD